MPPRRPRTVRIRYPYLASVCTLSPFSIVSRLSLESERKREKSPCSCGRRETVEKGESEQTTKDTGWLGSCVCLQIGKGRETRKIRGTRVARGTLVIFRGADEVKGERRTNETCSPLEKTMLLLYPTIINKTWPTEIEKKCFQIVEEVV
jgi:hypothetical protein